MQFGLNIPQFQPNQPQGVQSGQHQAPAAAPSFFDNLLNIGAGYLTGGTAGAIGAAFGGGGNQQQQSQGSGPTSSGVSSSGMQAADTMSQYSGELASQSMVPGLGQPLNNMNPEDRIGIDQGMQSGQMLGQPIPYLNPYSWE